MSYGIDYSRFDHIGSDTDSDEKGDNEYEYEEEEEDDDDDEEEEEQLQLHQQLNAGGEYSEEVPPNGWLRVGHVNIHPSERDNYSQNYSPTILSEDPWKFVPNPDDFEDGIVTNWGLKDTPIDQAAKGNPFMLAQAMMNRVNRDRISIGTYGDNDDPMKQFLTVLDQRKDAFIGNEKVQKLISSSSFYLKVSLLKCPSDIWRIVRVPAGIDLAKLHDQVLVPIMGWCRGYHGYVFQDPKDGAVLGPKKYNGYIDMMHAPMKFHYIMEDQRYPLAGLVQNVGDFIRYTYDLGDNWEHKIEVLDVVEIHSPKDDKATTAVHLLDGAGACPPEDGNGLDGLRYSEFLQEYKANPNSSKMKKTIRSVESSAVNYSKPWTGCEPIKFRPPDFDIQHHRLFLDLMIAGPTVQKTGKLGEEGYKHSIKACTGCGNRIKALLKCSKCGTLYCSRECQITDWKNHKKKCKERSAKREAKV
jgi:Plasmid pRiA4b ORF-3-like protein/MYND finger